MPKAVWNISFQLRKGVTQEEFIAATQVLHDEVLSKAKGFISWEQYLQGDTWTDFVTWETLEDANNGLHVGHGTEQAKKFYSLLKMQTCRMLTSTFVKRY